MGFGDWLDHAVTSVETSVGGVIENTAEVVGDGLNKIGLGDAGKTVARWGDEAGDALGYTDPEAELNESTDPTELVHGDAGKLASTVQELQKLAAGFGETGRAMSQLDTTHWTGAAADGFRSVYEPHKKQWSDAQDSCTKAAATLDAYAQTVKWAQDQAGKAIKLYQQGQQATQQAKEQALAQQGQALPTGPAILAEKPLAPANDPGLAARQQAQDILDRARQQRDSAGADAARAIQAAASLAPPEPSMGEKIRDESIDLLEMGATSYAHIEGGLVKFAAETVDFVRTLLPDGYNVRHPAEYLGGLSNTAAGLLTMVNHPNRILSSLAGSGWGSDPGEALGKLLGNIALTVATGGGGTAADATADVAINAGEHAAVSATEKAAADGVATAAEDGLSSAGRGVSGFDADCFSTDESWAEFQQAVNNGGFGLGNVERDLSQIHVGRLAGDPQVSADLAQTAVRPVDIGALDRQGVVWAKGSGKVRRLDSRGPGAMYHEGFVPKGNDLDLGAHVDYNSPQAAYVSTTTDVDYALENAADGDWEYDIDAPGGVDVNATLEKNQYSKESEIAYPGGIQPERIRGAWQIKRDPVTGEMTRGEYIPNPNYRPLFP